MKNAFTGLKLAICLAMLSMAPAFSQTTNDEAISNSASATVANIYLPAAGGVDVYSVNAAGKLTLVKGSPFSVTGEMEDVNGKYLISVGNTWLHSYPIESSGALGKQAGAINTQELRWLTVRRDQWTGLDARPHRKVPVCLPVFERRGRLRRYAVVSD